MHEKQKNKKITLIILLLLLVLVSSAFIGTLTKYMTSVETKDSAEVAKFGLNIPNSIALFSDSYSNVKADSAGRKIIAPGTSGQYQFEVEGTSEVAYIVSADIQLNYSSNWNDYEPLQFSIDGETWTDFSVFQENLTTALESEEMAPNQAYSSTQTIYWRWPFSSSSENDTNDTTMGIAAVAKETTVTVDILVIATQLEGDNH